jgi:hypothetical protein
MHQLILRRTAVLLSLFFCGPASGAIIVDYNMDVLSGTPTSVGAASTAPGVTGLAMTAGGGLSTISVSGPSAYFGTQGWDTSTADDFVEFGFTVQPGYVVEISQVSLSLQSRLRGPGVLGLYLSTNNFAGSTLLGTINMVGTGNDLNLVTPWVINVSVPSITTAGQLRIMEIGNQAANGDALGTGPAGSLRLFNTGGANVSVSGTVMLAAVPEPSHMAFVAVVAFGYLRRRKAKAVTMES